LSWVNWEWDIFHRKWHVCTLTLMNTNLTLATKYHPLDTHILYIKLLPSHSHSITLPSHLLFPIYPSHYNLISFLFIHILSFSSLSLIGSKIVYWLFRYPNLYQISLLSKILLFYLFLILTCNNHVLILHKLS